MPPSATRAHGPDRGSAGTHDRRDATRSRDLRTAGSCSGVSAQRLLAAPPRCLAASPLAPQRNRESRRDLQRLAGEQACGSSRGMRPSPLGAGAVEYRGRSVIKPDAGGIEVWRRGAQQWRIRLNQVLRWSTVGCTPVRQGVAQAALAAPTRFSTPISARYPIQFNAASATLGEVQTSPGQRRLESNSAIAS